MKAMIRTAVLVLGSILSQLALAADWEVVQPESRIGFVATYDDIPFQASFESFQARIRFSPENLDDSSFDVHIDTTSLDSESPDRDEGMKQAEWFAVDEYPEARFHAEQFEHISDNHYKAIGELTVKGISRKIEVPFTWEPQVDGNAWMTAQASLKRGDFDIGTGEWAKDETIGFDVSVNARLQLTGQ